MQSSQKIVILSISEESSNFPKKQYLSFPRRRESGGKYLIWMKILHWIPGSSPRMTYTVFLSKKVEDPETSSGGQWERFGGKDYVIPDSEEVNFVSAKEKPLWGVRNLANKQIPSNGFSSGKNFKMGNKEKNIFTFL
ncbi:hypothetical protein KGV55_01400 [Candidatus Gracilibacteria bacterium]|nr:hypothetical protein [Candidatus Gracilibacteria bacterium]